MQPNFGIARERHNKLYFKEYTDDSGIFHFHSQIELYFIDDGEMEVWVNDKNKILKKGEMSIALSYDAHAYRTVEHSKSSVLIIPAYTCEDFILATQQKRVTDPFLCDIQIVRKIKSYFGEIQKSNENKVKQLGYIYVILGILLENLKFQPAEEESNPQLSSRILFYINENYKEDISLNKLATEFGFSPSYLSKYFKSCFHIGFQPYLNMIRLKYALLLMQEEKHSITYCAMESGFRSMRTFYRVFDHELHCTPKQYLHQLHH